MKTKTLMSILGDDPRVSARICKYDCKDAYEAERWLRQHTDATLVPYKEGRSKWLDAEDDPVQITAFYSEEGTRPTAPIDEFTSVLTRDVCGITMEGTVEVLVTHYVPENKPRWDEEQFDAEIEFEVYTPGVDTPWVLSKKDWLKIAKVALMYMGRDRQFD